MSSLAYDPVRKLATSDGVESFDCGNGALNQFLQRFALVSHKSNSAQTYVSCRSDVVAGFYSLAVGSVEGSVAIAAVLASAFPVVTILLARVRLHETLAWWQWIGVAAIVSRLVSDHSW